MRSWKGAISFFLPEEECQLRLSWLHAGFSVRGRFDVCARFIFLLFEGVRHWVRGSVGKVRCHRACQWDGGNGISCSTPPGDSHQEIGFGSLWDSLRVKEKSLNVNQTYV